jgi:hypothetical protein
MAKPEKILLQEKAWRQHATIANGVKCGEDASLIGGLGLLSEGSRGSITGWGDYISLSGQLMELLWPNPTVDPDEIFKVQGMPSGMSTSPGGLAAYGGRRILGIMTNTVMPDLVRVVVDTGEDPEQPGQLECEVVLLGTEDLHEELVEVLKFNRRLPRD